MRTRSSLLCRGIDRKAQVRMRKGRILSVKAETANFYHQPPELFSHEGSILPSLLAGGVLGWSGSHYANTPLPNSYLVGLPSLSFLPSFIAYTMFYSGGKLRNSSSPSIVLWGQRLITWSSLPCSLQSFLSKCTVQIPGYSVIAREELVPFLFMWELHYFCSWQNKCRKRLTKQQLW